MTQRRAASTQSTGVSLLELLVVLAIIAALAAVAYPRLGGTGARSKVQTDALQLSARLKATRLAAVTGNRTETLSIDSVARTYWSSVDLMIWPMSSDIAFANCEALSGPGTTTGVRVIPFNQDGSARDCTIILGARDQAVRLRVDWLTGATALAGGTQ